MSHMYIISIYNVCSKRKWNSLCTGPAALVHVLGERGPATETSGVRHCVLILKKTRVLALEAVKLMEALGDVGEVR